MFVDKYGLFNTRPTAGIEPSGNDGWILTAYAVKLGLKIDQERVLEAYRMLRKDHKGMPLERLPGVKTPYLSRDVILGMVYLGLLTVQDLEDWNYSFSPLPIPRFNFFKAVVQFWRLRDKHRNHFWQNPGFEQIYRFAFSVPMGDRYAMQKRFGKPTLMQRLFGFIDFHLKPKTNSTKLIHWLKYDEAPEPKVFLETFGESHPLTQAFLSRKA